MDNKKLDKKTKNSINYFLKTDTLKFVGGGIREAREILRECGFRYVCTFRERKPVFHKL